MVPSGEPCPEPDGWQLYSLPCQDVHGILCVIQAVSGGAGRRRAVTHTVTVQRCRCGSCGHTHALLPATLVPYSSYSLRFILSVLRAYFLRTDTVAGICERVGIAISTLYRWKKLFLTHKQLWLGVLEAMHRDHCSFLDQLDGVALKSHYLAFRVSFLQSFRRTVREQPFSGAGQLFVST